MAKGNGHLNGHSNGDDRDNVTSLDDARRRAANKAKAEKRVAAGQSGARSVRDWIIGGMIVLMAIGYVASLFAGAPVVGGGE